MARMAAMIVGVLTFSSVLGLVNSNIVLHENGYEGVVVAIGEGVPEDPNIIENLKMMFMEGSEVLNEATRQRAYFREVTIVVPSTWNYSEDYMATTGLGWVSGADVRVDLPHPLHGDSPYTLQLGGCGDPGEYIHLSPEYAAKMYSSLLPTFGSPGKVLVHEWAHLRWGVFDEYGEPATSTPTFYIGEDMQVHVTGCTEGIKGWLRNIDGSECHADASGMPDSQCHFFPAEDSDNNITASLMNLYFLDNVRMFCDNEELPHNPYAPNAHNMQCDGRSVWEVITQHQDFKDGVVLCLVGYLVCLYIRYFVLSLHPRSDHGSQDLGPRSWVFLSQFVGVCYQGLYHLYLYLNEFTTRFVRDLVPTGSLLAVVSFANTSHLDLPFTVVPRDREDIVSKLPDTYVVGGYTAIGGALEFILQLVENTGTESEGLMVILITDGEETMYPKVETKLPAIKRKRIVINTVSFGPNATDSLELWAKETGGKSYYHSTGSSDSLSSLDALLYDSITTNLDQPDDQLLQVYRRTHEVAARGGLETGQVVLDSSLGHETRFTFTESIVSPYNPHQPGTSLAPAWEQPGTSLAPAWHQPGTSMVPAWEQPGTSLAPAWHQPGTCLGTAWHLPGTSLAPAWHQPGTSLAPVWHQPGTSLAPAWEQPGTSLAPVWHQPGTSLAPAWEQPGTSLAPVWHQPGTSLAPAWHQPGTCLAPAWHQPGTNLAPAWHQPRWLMGFKAGRWTYIIRNPAGHPRTYPQPDEVQVAVTSHPSRKTGQAPVRVKAWMSANNITYPEPALVFAYVSQGYSMVLDATVTAFIVPPTEEKSISFPLLDNGVGADLRSGDGIYSAFFTQYSGNGRYSVSATVSTSNRTAKLQALSGAPEGHLRQPGTSALRRLTLPLTVSLPEPDSTFAPGDLVPSEEPSGAPHAPCCGDVNRMRVEPFTRFTSGGIFKVHNYQPGDQQPPGRVTDLTVSFVYLYDALVSLTWTSPGDDLYTGTATVLELRYHESMSIHSNFHVGHQVNSSHLTSGDLTPRPAGQPHNITLKMLDRSVESLEGRAVFFVVRARDEMGNSGNLSNLATAYFPLKKYTRNIQEEQKMDAMSGLVVLVVLGVIILVMVIFVASVKMLHVRNRKARKEQQLVRREQQVLEGGNVNRFCG
nr:calcium-activated chloride channel regulator 1-like [Cherax quadricarinatus]